MGSCWRFVAWLLRRLEREGYEGCIRMSDLWRIVLDPNDPECSPLDTEWWLSDGDGRDAGWLVPAEPTDRICETHLGVLLQLSEHEPEDKEPDVLCWNFYDDPSQPCEWIDVARTEVSE